MLFRIREYIKENGANPFREWLNSLDIKTKARVQIRILRVEQGNLGDYKNLSDGVFELRLHFDSGIRMYFARDGANIILLLAGGDKGSQRKDIANAKSYWSKYRKGGKHGS